MNTTNSLLRPRAGSLLLLALASASISLAQSPDSPATATDSPDASARPPIDLLIDYSSTSAGPTDFRGGERTESGAQTATFALSGSISLGAPPKGEENTPPVPSKWKLSLGLLSQNISFDDVPDAPVPDAVHTLSLNTGLSYRLNDTWTFTANVSPTLYRLDDVGSSDIGVRGGVMATWRRSPSLLWMFGVMADPDGEFPVLPMVGANWRINPEFTLSLVVPRPQLVYRPSNRWRFHVGANLTGATFRTSDTFGTERGEPRYNRALASYRDIRFGAGFALQVNRRLSIEAEGGYSVNRQIDYTRIDERVKFDPAPYFQVGLRAKF